MTTLFDCRNKWAISIQKPNVNGLLGLNFMAFICNKSSAVFFAVSLFKIISQMYKVFVNDTPIIITSSSKKTNNFPVYILKNIVVVEIIDKIKEQ